MSQRSTGDVTYLKFRRNVLFESEHLRVDVTSPFAASIATVDLWSFRNVWREIREDLDYKDVAVTGEYFDDFEDLLPGGISELQHLDSNGDKLPCVGAPRIAEQRSNRWLPTCEGAEGDIVVVAWRTTHCGKGFYTYSLPPGLAELDLADVALATADGLGDASFYIDGVMFRGQPCRLAHAEDGGLNVGCYAAHCWIREDGEWLRVWALDDRMGDDIALSGFKSLASVSVVDEEQLISATFNTLPSLVSLEMIGCGALKSAAFTALPSLTTLKLTDCAELTTLGSLEGLIAVTSLDLSGCSKLTELSALAGLEGLASLSLGGEYDYRCSELTDLAPLAGLTALRNLKLRYFDNVTDLGPLSGLKALTSLDLSGCSKLSDIAPLAGLAALQSLNLCFCDNVTDLGPLSGLKALTSLDLDGCEGLPSELRKEWQSKELQTLLGTLARSEIAAPADTASLTTKKNASKKTTRPKAPKKAAKKRAQRKSSKKAAKATTKKTSKKSSKQAAKATKKTAKKRSPRR